MTSTQIKDNIQAHIKNKTTSKSISNIDVANDMESIVDYIDQETSNLGVAVTKVAKTTITSSQILDIFTTPIDIVQAPGVGKLIIASFITIVPTYNSTPYSNTGGTWKLTFGTNNVSIATITSHLGLSFSKPIIHSLYYNNTDTSGTFIDQPLKLTTSINNPIGGDSDVNVYVTYEEITL